MQPSRLRACLACAAAFSLLAAHAVYAQLVPVTPKVLKQHRDEYMQAMDEWQNGDKSLEKDLHSGDRQTLIDRINKEAARTAKFLDSKRTYFSSLRSYYQDQYIRVEGATGSGAKPPQTKEEIQEHIDGVARERADLDDRMRQTSDIQIRQKLFMQQTALKTIQDNLVEQKALVDRWERADTGIAESRKAMLASLRRITDVLASQEQGVGEIKDQLDRVYASMRSTAGPLAKTTAQPPPPPPAEQPKPAEAPKPVEQPKPQTAAAPMSIAGTWLFAGADPGLPKTVRIEVGTTDTNVIGRFQAAQVPKTFCKLPPTADFPFGGPKTDTKFHWTFGNQAGIIEFLPASATTVNVVVTLDGASVACFDKLVGRMN